LAANATGEAESGPLRLQFDRSVKLSSISSDGGLLLYRELDGALGLLDMAAESIGDPRTGKNGRHRLVGFLRQSVFSRLAGCEDVNDADRLCRDPVMRQLIGGPGGEAWCGLGKYDGSVRDRDADETREPRGPR